MKLKRTILTLALLLNVCVVTMAQSSYYMDKARSYMRDAEYYISKAENYDREADYHLKKAKDYQREVDYYTRNKQADKVRTYQRKVDDETAKARQQQRWATEAKENARKFTPGKYRDAQSSSESTGPDPENAGHPSPRGNTSAEGNI
jgi:hypothetical protein